MTLQISVESEKFPSGALADGKQDVSVEWDEILWAAVTVGRPNRQFVFRHGGASFFEALFRWSLVRMALEQNGPNSTRLRRTTAARTLDPSEKGAINYFLGMTFCKLFADKLLHTPWLLHLDLFRPEFNAILSGRSRPDLFGKTSSGNVWHSFECKGRISPPDSKTKQKAKAQAKRLISVDGIDCTCHVGAVTYFHKDVLEFYWLDPVPEDGKKIEVTLGESPWRHYYKPIVDLISGLDGWDTISNSSTSRSEPSMDGLVSVVQADLQIGVHPRIASLLRERNWNDAHAVAVELSDELITSGFRRDGIRLQAGPSWQERFTETAQDGT